MKGEEDMGRIMLATSASTDEEYGGIIEKKYSTTEQVVGTWIDGKPLYEKSYIWTSTEITSESINLPVDLATIGADVVFIESGYMIDFNNNICPIPYSHPEAMYNVGVFIQSSKANVGVRASTGRAIKYLSLTIRYTKTTS